MTEEEAQKLLKEYHVPENIRKHCEKVAFLAEIIARKYVNAGIKIDVEMIKIAALLHDLFRIVDIEGDAYEELKKNASPEDIKIWDSVKTEYKGLLHCQAAAEYFTNHGKNKLARLISCHRFDAILEEKERPLTVEEKIVSYADKRVLHTEIVTLQKRFEDGQERYNPDNENMEKIKRIHEAYIVLEKEIFSVIGEV